jgi:transmembrane sensor
MEMKDELLMKFLLKETGEEENAVVQNWLMQSEVNAKYFADFEKIWLESKNLVQITNVDTEEAWKKFKSKVDDRTLATPIVKPLKTNYNWLKIAAVLVFAIGAWTVYTFFSSSNYTDLVAYDQVTQELLPDGSELTINKNTQISYAGNFESNRNLKLKQGEVFFNVKPDKNHPFVIEIANVEVEVVGTSFNIKHLNEKTEVVVETGIVKVKLGHQEVQLLKGEKVYLSAATKELIKQENTDQLYNYYRTKLFVANNVSLEKLISVLNEAYGSDVILAENIANLKFNSTLELGSLDNNLAIICEALNLKISRNQNQILLSNQ